MQAFDTALSHFGIPKVLEAADMVVRKVPDRLGVMTYLFQLQDYFTWEHECHGSDNVDSVNSVLAVSSDVDTRQTADNTSGDCQQAAHEFSVSNSNCNAVTLSLASFRLFCMKIIVYMQDPVFCGKFCQIPRCSL